MFEVGKRYTLTMLEGGENRSVSGDWLVMAVSMPIVEFKRAGKSTIVNTSSSVFVDASLSEYQSCELPVLHITDFSEEPAAD